MISPVVERSLTISPEGFTCSFLAPVEKGSVGQAVNTAPVNMAPAPFRKFLLLICSFNGMIFGKSTIGVLGLFIYPGLNVFFRSSSLRSWQLIQINLDQPAILR